MLNSFQKNRCWKEIGIDGNGSCEKLTSIGHCRHCEEYSIMGRSLLNKKIPDGFKEYWTDIISKPKEIEKAGTISLAVFKIGDEWLALKTVYFIEVVDSKTIHYVPYRSDKIFLGLVNISGELLLCISALEFFEVDRNDSLIEQKKESKKMVVISNGSVRYVYPVDDFLGIFRIPPEDILKTPVTVSKSPNSFTIGVFNLTGKSIGLIDENILFDTLKKKLFW